MSRLSVAHYAKNLKLLERNREWWLASGVSTADKSLYYAHMVVGIVRPGKRVNYLGNMLHFDNPATPLNMQNYPYEITRKILGNMHKSPKKILDVGANIGQFSLTMDHVLGHKARIDAFEPNPYVFDLLQKNVVKNAKTIKVYNYGVGEKDGNAKIHYNPTRTAIASIIKQNAGVDATQTAEIKVTGHVEKVTKQSGYDLVKVDVEGYEYHTLKGLAHLSFEYLFLEVSGLGRQKDYNHSDIFALLKKQWGDYDICYIGGSQKDSDTFDMLVRFRKNKSK